MTTNADDLKDFVLEILQEKNAEDINVMKLANEVALAKYMIFTTGKSIKNISSIAEIISLELKHKLHHASSLEGLKGSDWIVLDAGEVIVHLFNPESRDAIKLDQLWNRRNNSLN
ncbi:MAG TPA: ribosome silencing factor [Candidatus Megaira endosymbiont of Nemacystus decipiens]|nr:ribosome silencing factor [Candidatus Megaera endosymbiont of Nemacystus decipiens]